jgi:RNA ligase
MLSAPAPAVDLAKLRDLAEKRLISTQRHPELPLLIHDYSRSCQYDRAWNDLTLICRGLITDLEGRIVARPLPKFFNLAEHLDHQANPPEGFRLPPINWHQNFTALRKYDGSLGILYFAPDGPRLATRGSFKSEQAIRGTEILREKGYAQIIDGMDDEAKRTCTLVFEIIFKENRIVVDYGDMEDLVLLDVIDIATGRGRPWADVEAAASLIGCPVAERIEANAEALQSMHETSRDNEEGYVVRFEDGTRVKTKFQEYVRLHRLVTQVTSRTIWECLMTGDGLADMLERVPDEFDVWVRKTAGEISDLHAALEGEARRLAYQVPKEAEAIADPKQRSRWIHEQFGQRASDPRAAHVAYTMWKGKYDQPFHREWLWRQVRPAFSSPFKDDQA